MQGLADGYFVIPYTIGNFLADEIRTKAIPTTHPAFEETEKTVKERIEKLMNIKGKKQLKACINVLEKLCGINVVWQEMQKD